MPMDNRARLLMVIGAIMVGIGLWVSYRRFMPGQDPIGSNLWIDVGFVVFFLLRGGMNIRKAQRMGSGGDST
jgi:hypothetical protein